MIQFDQSSFFPLSPSLSIGLAVAIHFSSTLYLFHLPETSHGFCDREEGTGPELIVPAAGAVCESR